MSQQLKIRPQIQASQLSPNSNRRFQSAATNSVRYQTFNSKIPAHSIISASNIMACNEESTPAGVRLRYLAPSVS